VWPLVEKPEEPVWDKPYAAGNAAQEQKPLKNGKNPGKSSGGAKGGGSREPGDYLGIRNAQCKATVKRGFAKLRLCH